MLFLVLGREWRLRSVHVAQGGAQLEEGVGAADVIPELNRGSHWLDLSTCFCFCHKFAHLSNEHSF